MFTSAASLMFYFSLLLAVLLSTSSSASETTTVCFEGFIMDRYCIDRGTLLDAPDLSTLGHPSKHSVHCLVDVASCRNSVFEALQLSPDSSSGLHCRAYSLDSAGRSMVVDLARSTFKCSTCSPEDPDSALSRGFSAVLVGTTPSNPASSSSTPPLLSVTSVLPAGSSCPDGSAPLTNPTQSSLCSSGGFIPAIRAHGSLMLLSWGLLLPLGVLSARYLRHKPDALWFKLHRGMQVLGLLLAAGGFAVALSNFSVFNKGASARSLAHGCVGVFVMALGLMQPLNAFFRPHSSSAGEEKTPARKKWELLHKGSGYTAVYLAPINILVGATIAGGPWVLVVAAFFGALALALYFMWRDRRKFLLQERASGGDEDAQLT